MYFCFIIIHPFFMHAFEVDSFHSLYRMRFYFMSVRVIVLLLKLMNFTICSTIFSLYIVRFSFLKGTFDFFLFFCCHTVEPICCYSEMVFRTESICQMFQASVLLYGLASLPSLIGNQVETIRKPCIPHSESVLGVVSVLILN